MYKNLFFDLDDTLWAFTENARDTFIQLYDKYAYGRFFESFEHYYALYQKRNIELWGDYASGAISKEELNRIRFSYPLIQVGVENAEELSRVYTKDFLSMIPLCTKVMPHAHEVLQELSGRYNLYILSNGFEELQSRKMHSSGLDKYFKKMVLSDDLGVLKPRPEIFHFALSATQSQLKESLMIGDSWENDIVGAQGVGMHQVYYNVSGKTDLPFKPTYQIGDLKELLQIL